MSEESLDIPQADSADAAHLVASTLIGLIPFVGGADLFKFIVSPSLERRKERWMQLVVDAIKELQARGEFSIDVLRDNEEFTTLLLQTTQAAYKTHLEAKHVLLKAGLKNSFSSDFSFDMKQLCISLLDKFSPLHIVILSLVESKKYLSVKCNSGNQFYDRLVDLKDPIALDTNGVLFLDILEDLHQVGLLVTSSNFIITDGDVYQQPMRGIAGQEKPNLQRIDTSDLATYFLRFIKE